MPRDACAVHDRWGRLCFGGAAGSVVVFAWAVTINLALYGPGPRLKTTPYNFTLDYAIGYGLPFGIIVGIAVAFAVRPSARIRPPLPALMACCFAVWFVGSALTPAIARFGPPPFHELLPWAVGVAAGALGLIGLPVIWAVYPPTQHTETERRDVIEKK